MSRIRIQTPSRTYHKVVKQIHKIVHTFIKQKGGDWYELRSVADSGYIAAMHTYTPTKGTKFSTWVQTKVQSYLEDYHKKEKRIGRQFKPIDPSVLYDLPYDDREFDLDDFIDNLPPDAKVIVTLLMDQPVILRYMIGPAVNHPPSLKKAIRKFVRIKYRWDYARLRKAFDQVTKAIGGRTC